MRRSPAGPGTSLASGDGSLLLRQPATVKAATPTDLYVLEKSDFSRILRDNPKFATAIQQVAKDRFSITMKPA